MRVAAKGLGLVMLAGLYVAIMWRVFGADPVPQSSANRQVVEPVPHIFVNGEVADADQVNENFQHLIDFASGLETLATELTGRATDLETNQTELTGRVTDAETAQTGLTERVTALETLIPPTQTPQGTILTRWGNGTAPAGTTLIYSGFAYASRDIDDGGVLPMVIQTGDPGATAANLFSRADRGV